MKQKDIILVVISVVLLAVSLYFIVNMLGIGGAQKKQTEVVTQSSQNQTEITGKFDQTTLDKLKSLKDYGGAELTDIGRVNPFGPLN